MNETLIYEKIVIPASRGTLAAELCYTTENPSMLCLLLNPHPHMGGSMKNNLIEHLSEHLVECKVATLKFDYAGIGESEGKTVDLMKSMAEFWNTGSSVEDRGMIEDAQTVVDWADRSLGLPIVLIGYSFGTFVASEMIKEHQRACVMINPTLTQHGITVPDEIAARTLVLYASDDFATPESTTSQWLEGLSKSVNSVRFEGGDHFYRKREHEVASHVKSFIQSITSTES